MILNKTIKKDITIKEVNEDFKIILEFAKKNKTKTIKDLSDYEIFIYCIIDTCNYGRSFKESVQNALIHLENKERYLNLITTPDVEELIF